MKSILSLFLLVFYSSVFAGAPANVVLVDTGYDLCIKMHGKECQKNKNLLFRGGQPFGLDQKSFPSSQFKQKLFTSIEFFQKNYKTQAILPTTTLDLTQYRIVMVDLVYGYSRRPQRKQREKVELQKAFQYSGNADGDVLPLQHQLYGLFKSFSPDQYAFLWWPISFKKRSFFHWQHGLSDLNRAYLPNYIAMNFPALIQNLGTLLSTIPHDGHPLLIFYHCVAGEDRTGAVTIAYYMKFGGYPAMIGKSNHVGSDEKREALAVRDNPLNLQQASWATAIPGAVANDRAEALATQYCHYLQKTAANCRFHRGLWGLLRKGR